jgi:hypothetical protein
VSTEAINRTRNAVSTQDRHERAQQAVKVFRSMQHGLTSYARAITGDKNVRVEIAAGPPRTDGKIIKYCPPIELGDRTPHVALDCSKRGDDGLQLCPACRVREEVLVNIYHEIAHIAFGTFEETSEDAKKNAINLAIKECGGKYEEQIRVRFGTATIKQRSSYLGLAGLVSPFLPYLVNCLEDARVDSRMFRERKGTRKMLTADTFAILAQGVPDKEGELKYLKDSDPNTQIALGCYLSGAGYEGFEKFLHPTVAEHLNDSVIASLIFRLRMAEDAAATYNLAFPVLARLRELGYFLLPEDEPEEKEEEKADEGDDASGGTDGSDGESEAETDPEGAGDSPPLDDGDPGRADDSADANGASGDEATPESTGGSDDGEGGDGPGAPGEGEGSDDSGADGTDPVDAGDDSSDQRGAKASEDGEGGAGGDAGDLSDGSRDESATADAGEAPDAEGAAEPSTGPGEGEGAGGADGTSDLDGSANPGDAPAEGAGEASGEHEASGVPGDAGSDVEPGGAEGGDQEPAGDAGSPGQPGSDDAVEPRGDEHSEAQGESYGNPEDSSTPAGDGGGHGADEGQGADEAGEDAPRDGRDGGTGGDARDDREHDEVNQGPSGAGEEDTPNADSGSDPSASQEGLTDGADQDEVPGAAGGSREDARDGKDPSGDAGAVPEGSPIGTDGPDDGAASAGQPSPSGGSPAQVGNSMGQDVAGSDGGLQEPTGGNQGPQLDNDPRDGQGGETASTDSTPSAQGFENYADDGDVNSPPGDESGPAHEGDRPDGLIDSGADKGLGGIVVEEADPLPEFGTPEDLAAALGHVHEHIEGPKLGEKVEIGNLNADQKAIATAIIQGAYFETPSKGVALVEEWSYDPTKKNKDQPAPGWVWQPIWDERDAKNNGVICDLDIPESALGPALLRTRRIFNDNKTSSYENNKRSGRVNAKVLGRRAWNDDDRLFGKKRVPGKKDYTVLIGIDISSSNLGSNLALVKRAAFAQAELLHRVGIPFEIVAHSANGVRLKNAEIAYVMHLHHVKDLEEPWNDLTKERMAKLVGTGGNLDGHALEYMRKRLVKTTTTDKILLYYADGKMPAANADEELQVLERQIKLCKRDDITLLGVGIRTDSPIRHGLDTVQVDDDEDLPRVIEHLGKRLRK